MYLFAPLLNQPPFYRFRTIMAYPCSRSTQDDESSSFAEQINYFSNPDVDYLGLPTGTATENVARMLRENMVRNVPSAVENNVVCCATPPRETAKPIVAARLLSFFGIKLLPLVHTYTYIHHKYMHKLCTCKSTLLLFRRLQAKFPGVVLNCFQSRVSRDVTASHIY